MNSISPTIKLFFDVASLPKGKAAVYGTGGAGRTILRAIADSRSDIEVLFFLDTFREGTFEGKPVHRFESVTKAQLAACDIIVVASTFFHQIVPMLFARGVSTCMAYEPRLAANPDQALSQLRLDIRCRMEDLFLLEEPPQINERSVEYAFVFKWLAKYCPATILDVGSGVTALPQVMRQCGFAVTAIDFNALYNIHFPVRFGDITAVDFDHSFDAVVCVSVLEHIGDHELAIKNMRYLLGNSGILLLTCPFNESRFIANVNDVKGISSTVVTNDLTKVFSRKMVNEWVASHDWEIVDEVLYTLYSGPHFGLGEVLPKPQIAASSQEADLICLALSTT